MIRQASNARPRAQRSIRPSALTMLAAALPDFNVRPPLRHHARFYDSGYEIGHVDGFRDGYHEGFLAGQKAARGERS